MNDELFVYVFLQLLFNCPIFAVFWGELCRKREHSVGKKGIRFSKSANGRTTSTVSIPGTGLSYIQDLGGKKKSTKAKNKQVRQAKSL